MAEIGIDQSKLPGVKEVCRDFAILEDHTLAHNLQEQEIEHHLATNIQRNRLVQNDLQVAKQLQEEENRKAHSRVQEHHKNIEQQDCEIAQEIQVKLVFEAEQRRRQEEDDEDIARILQQKELREEKRRKKPTPSAEPLRPSPYEEGFYQDSREEISGGPWEQAPELARPRPPQQPRDRRRGPPLVSEGLDLEVLGSSSEVSKARDGRRKPGHRDKPRRPPLDEEEDGDVGRGCSGSRESRERRAGSRERAKGSASLILDGEEDHAPWGSRGARERQTRSQERPQRSPPRLRDWEAEERGRRRRGQPESHSPSVEKSLRPPGQEDRPLERRDGTSRSPNPAYYRLPREGRCSPSASHDPRIQDSDASRWVGHRREGERAFEGASHGARAAPSSPHREGRETVRGRRQIPGLKAQGSKEATYQKPRGAGHAPAFCDAEVARQMQEEELLASHVDKRAAQVAQDEEIARLLMAEEKAAYRKAKEREKAALDKRRQDQDWKDTHELVHPRSREGHEGHRYRSDKPTRPPPPPTEDLGPLGGLVGPQLSAHQSSKPESSHRGSHYKQ
ncbi:coiled-coil domain-containing protein 50 isoform X2 [Paroedura picta]|uniref:coiled-coil domain-containing protein 50 isoform X2 n=1 Tax=Paroedura picta TaxID=143630 RepID=UPI0040565711